MKTNNKLSYQNKFKILIGGGLFFLIVCYYQAIRPTVREYLLFKSNGINQMHQEITNELQILYLQNDVLEKQLSQFKFNTPSDQNKLLGLVTEVCIDNQLQLKEFRPAYTESISKYKLVTHIVSVEGSFLNCLQLVYIIETISKQSKVASVNFEKNRNTSLNDIICTIYLQNVAL